MYIRPKKVKVFPLQIENIKVILPMSEEFNIDEYENAMKRLGERKDTEPIVVTFCSEGYQLIKGLSIYQAYLKNERKIIPAIIKRK